MRRFGKQKTANAAPKNDPLTAIPLKPENVEVKSDGEGCLHLRMRPVLKPFQQKVATWLRYDYTRRLELDEYGSFYYGLVDGKRTLATIVDELTAKLGKERKEVAVMVVTFTKTLMTRNMISLKVPTTGRSR